jgi:MbtH protein
MSDVYRVVRNDEEQYSIWDAGTAAPAGWHDAGFTGTTAECLAHIDRVWTDLRPRSVRTAEHG